MFVLCAVASAGVRNYTIYRAIWASSRYMYLHPQHLYLFCPHNATQCNVISFWLFGCFCLFAVIKSNKRQARASKVALMGGLINKQTNKITNRFAPQLFTWPRVPMINGPSYAQLHLHVHLILAFKWKIWMDLMGLSELNKIDMGKSKGLR